MSGHEQAARAGGQRARAGDKRVEPIAPATAATWTGRDRGQPLPGPLKAWLERRLDADLAAVRVHADAETRAATTAAGALALTRGCHIDLGERAPDWRTADGAELYAHEAIHVLQQTAVRSADGRLRASDRAGGGEAQAAPDLDLGAELAGVFAAAPTLDQLLDGYMSQFAGDRALETTASRMHAGETPSVDEGKAAAPRSAALIADSFKLRGDWDSARAILAAHPPLPTGFRSLAFYRHVVAEAPALIGRAAAVVQVPQIAAGVRALLLGPHRAPDTAVAIAWRAPPLATGEVGRSEVSVGGARAAEVAAGLIAGELAKRYRALEDEVVKGQRVGAARDGVALRIALAAAIVKADGAIVKSKVREVREVLVQLAPALVAVAGDAAALWTRARRVATVIDRGSGTDQAEIDHVLDVRDRLKARDLEPAIAGAIKTVLDSAGTRSREDFETLLATARAALWAVAEPLALELASRAPAELGSDDSLALGLALDGLAALVHVLRIFDERRDRALLTASLYDARIAVGIHVALVARQVGLRFSMAKLLALGDDFLAISRLAITGEWKETAAARGRFGDEMGKRGGSLSPIGLTWWAIDLAAHVTYDLRLAQELETASIMTLPGQSARAEARKASQATGRPRRFVAPAVFWNQEPDSVGRLGASISGGATMVMQHPLASGQVEKMRHGAQVMWAVPPHAQGLRDQVVLWIIPDLEAMVERLKLVPSLDERVQKRWRKTHASGEPGPWSWLETLVEVADALPQEARKGAYDRAELADAVRAQVRADSARAIAERERAMLHATSFDREQLVSALASRLRSYDRHDRATLPRIKTLGEELESFLISVEPRRDRPVHAAAVALALAPALVAAIGGSRIDVDFPVIAILSPLMIGAIALWDDQAGQAGVLAAQPDGGDRAHVESLVAILRPLAKAYAAYADAQERRDGFIAEKDKRLHHVLGTLGAFEVGGSYQVGSKRPGARKPKPSDQIRLTLLAVHEDFRYHAGLRVDELGAEWPVGLVVPGRARLLDGAGDAWKTNHTKLVTYAIAGKKVEVHDDEPGELAVLDEMVGRWFFIGTMANTQAAIEWAFNKVLDAAEFIPGIGQGITLARFGVALLDFIANDLPAVSEALGGFSFDGLWKSVDALVDRPELLLLRFLDADLDFAPRNPHVDDRAEPIRQKTGPWARLARFIGRIYDLAAGVGRKLAALQPVVVAPIHTLEDQIATHHGAAVLAYLVERWGDTLLSMLDDPAGLADLTDDVIEGALGWIGGVLHAVDALRTFSMPAKLIDMTVIVDIVVEIVLNQLGGKAEVIARGGKAILDTIGMWDDVLAEITSVITSFAGDPNDLFVEAIQGPLSGLLEGVRAGMVGTLGKGLGELPFLANVTAVTSPDVGDPLIIQPDPEEEIEAMPAPGAAASPADLAEAGGSLAGGTTMGQRLAPPVRQWAESTLGHDLGHVRAHQDGAADAIVRSAGALAVTTGSHVLLRDDVDVATRRGAGVLAHELTHVVQQTGARPLGAVHSDAAVTGARRGGLHVDAGREADADAAARRVDLGGAPALAPIAVGAADGLQPSLGPFLRRFVGHLRRTDLIRERARDLLDDKVGAADRKLGAALIGSLMTLIKGSRSKWKPTFLAARDKIEAYLGGKRDDLIVGAANAVEEARTTVKPRMGKGVSHVRPGVIRAVLTDAIFGLTGVGLELTMTPQRGTGALGRHHVLDDATPFSAVEIKFVHLGFVGSGSSLWKDVMNASFGTKYSGLYTEAQYRAAARLLLERRGVQLRVWDRNTFSFSKTFIAEVDEWLRQGELPAEWLPSPADYLSATPVSAVGDKGQHGQIGLRLGLYRDRKGADDGGDSSQKGTGRASHHLTQWLVVDYLANQNSVKMFDAKNKKAVFQMDPPQEFGLKADSSGRITAMGDGGDVIDIKTLAVGRGAEMPAILISRHAHQRGHAHIDPVEPDQGGDKSQGNHLARLMKAAAKGQDLPLTRQQLDESTLTDLPTRFFTAARETYRGAREITLDALKATVFVAERTYYNTLAEEAHRSDRITATQTNAVHAKAVTFNNDTLAKWGLR